jgi:hypothetical protein
MDCFESSIKSGKAGKSAGKGHGKERDNIFDHKSSKSAKRSKRARCKPVVDDEQSLVFSKLEEHPSDAQTVNVRFAIGLLILTGLSFFFTGR